MSRLRWIKGETFVENAIATFEDYLNDLKRFLREEMYVRKITGAVYRLLFECYFERFIIAASSSAT